MNIKLTAGWFYGALVMILAAWILHSFVPALLAACVTAIASWPLYSRFTQRMPPRLSRGVVSLAFTLAMVVFVLAPLLFAFGALLTEARAFAQEVAADDNGTAFRSGLASVPLIGPWLAARWQTELARAGGVSLLMQQVDSSALLEWAQVAGTFMIRHVFIILFTVLVLFFLYQEGESLARNLRRLLRHHIGERAEAYADVATRALRASVNSMLVVALVDGFASGIAYRVAGIPHPMVWGAITGAFALVPFLGYAAVAALSIRLAVTGATTLAFVAFALGCLVLLCGDKVVRPALARSGTHLHFVWVLMGCLGGFEVLGLVGLVIGPVVISLTRELWEQRVRDLAVADVPVARMS
jgi:predicted PurR-regulated permease PerM